MNDQAMAADDFLAHYGVKGMKWGVRKKVRGADIVDARRRLNSYDAARTKAKLDQGEAIRSGNKQSQRKAEKKIADLNASYLRDPDRATALRMTMGERAVLTILAVAIPGAGTASAAIASGARVATRKTIEKRQATGYYDRKK